MARRSLAYTYAEQDAALNDLLQRLTAAAGKGDEDADYRSVTAEFAPAESGADLLLRVGPLHVFLRKMYGLGSYDQAVLECFVEAETRDGSVYEVPVGEVSPRRATEYRSLRHESDLRLFYEILDAALDRVVEEFGEAATIGKSGRVQVLRHGEERRRIGLRAW